jgi:hypothetical protein
VIDCPLTTQIGVTDDELHGAVRSQLVVASDAVEAPSFHFSVIPSPVQGAEVQEPSGAGVFSYTETR